MVESVFDVYDDDDDEEKQDVDIRKSKLPSAFNIVCFIDRRENVVGICFEVTLPQSYFRGYIIAARRKNLILMITTFKVFKFRTQEFDFMVFLVNRCTEKSNLASDQPKA